MNPLRRLSIGLRIGISSLLIAVVLLSGAALVFRAQVATILTTTTTTLLSHDIAPYAAQIAAQPGDVTDVPGRGQLIAIIDPSGTVVQNSLPKSLAAQPARLLDLGAHGEVTRGDDTYSVLHQAVQTEAGDWQVIAVRNLDSSTLVLDHITIALAWGAAVLAVVSGLAAWLLTGTALRPVARMSRQAEALSRGESSEPLPVGPARDELFALGMTLNDFIASSHRSTERERQLVSDASHELRSPLAVLMAQLELAHLHSGDAAALEAEITKAESSVQRISSLALSLLELSQLQTPATAGPSTWTELSEAFASSVDDARTRASSTSVTIDFDIESDTRSARYPLEPSNLRRLISNVASNAIAALGETGTLRLAMRQAPGWLVLTAHDSGPGMPADFIPVAFDRFSRPDSSRHRDTGGHGLGLAIVHSIVERSGGTVALTNSDGLVVTVSIPEASQLGGPVAL